MRRSRTRVKYPADPTKTDPNGNALNGTVGPMTYAGGSSVYLGGSSCLRSAALTTIDLYPYRD